MKTEADILAEPHNEIIERHVALHAESRESPLHPHHNEDAFFVDRAHRAFGVLDGLGGYEKGIVASHLAALYIESDIARMSDDIPPENAVEELKRILIDASEILSLAWRKRRRAIRQLSQGLNTPHDGNLLAEILNDIRVIRDTLKSKSDSTSTIEPMPFGFGTTVVVAKETKDLSGKEYLAAAAVGDSRLYVLHKDGLLEACTLDNAIGGRHASDKDWERQRRLAAIERRTDFRGSDERNAFKERHMVTQALCKGFTEKNPDGPTAFLQVAPYTAIIEIQEGDIFFATSDGIHDNLTDEEIATIARKNRSENIAEALIVASYDRSLDTTHMRSKSDDMTVVVYDTNVSAHHESAQGKNNSLENIMREIRFAKSEKDLLRALLLAPLIPGNKTGEWHDTRMLHQQVENFFRGTGTLDAISNQLVRNKAESLTRAED